MINRRQFFRKFGFASVSLTVLAVSKGQAENIDPTRSYLREDGLVSVSTRWLAVSHSHVLVVPIETLFHPPADGVILKTSIILAHFHKVPLTQAQLIAIGNGQAVEVFDSTVGEHLFHLELRGGLKGLD
jgi:hypothetical protein